MSTLPYPPGTKCRYAHSGDIVVSLWGGDIVSVMSVHPKLPAMVEVMCESGYTDYVQWTDLTPLSEETPVTYETFKLDDKTEVRVSSNRDHAVIDHRGVATLKLSKAAAVELLGVLNTQFVLDALGDV